MNGSTRAAIITMCDDGTALIDMGGARATSGAPTTMCQIAAETLGMTFADVRCGEWGNGVSAMPKPFMAPAHRPSRRWPGGPW